MKLILIIYLLLWVTNLDAATLNTTGTPADCQTQIGNAVSGDTVLFPANGSFSWASGVSVTGSKSITIALNGSTITRSGTGYDIFAFAPTASIATTNRLTGSAGGSDTAMGSIQEGANGNNGGSYVAISITGQFTNTWFRWDHLNLFASTACTHAGILTANGVIDHCYITAPDNSEQLHNYGWGNNNATNGWLDSVSPGTINAVVFEDCNFTNNGSSTSFFGNSAVQTYYGGRVTARHNTFYDSQIDCHGGATAGTRIWEFYLNDWYLKSSENQDRYIALRAGSGYIWSNSQHGTDLGAGNIDFSLEGDVVAFHAGTGGPLAGGTTPILVPCYCWSNSPGMSVTFDGNMVPGSAPGGSVNLVTNTPASYTPLVYPHPFVTGPINSAGLTLGSGAMQINGAGGGVVIGTGQ